MTTCLDDSLLPSMLDDAIPVAKHTAADIDLDAATPATAKEVSPNVFTPPSFVHNAIALVKSPPFTTTVTTVAVFVILANSLTLGLESLWSDVGNCWEVIFALIESVAGPHPFFLFVGVSSILHMSLYWLVTLPITLLDVSADTLSVHALSPYKMQPYKNVPLDMDKLSRCIRAVLFNQCVVSVPVIIIAYPLAVMRGCGMTLPLPTFTVFVRDIIIMLIVEEVIFYYCHRLLHHPAVYGHVHKVHHEWTSPIAVAAIYAHPIEHILSNLLPVLMGPLLLGSHVAVWWVWESMALLMAINTHCGYHLPFLPSPESHDYHHQKFNVNFGVLGVLDWFHGTDAMFKQSAVYPQHRTFFSLDGFMPGAARVNQVQSVLQQTNSALDKPTSVTADVNTFDPADCSKSELAADNSHLFSSTTASSSSSSLSLSSSSPASSTATLLESDMTI